MDLSVLALAAAAALSVLGAYLMMKGQAWHDRNRGAYTLIFPSDLSTQQVVMWLGAVSGSMQRRGLAGKPSIVFELWSDHTGITHRLKVPWQEADYIIRQLRGMVPGVHVVQEKEPPAHEWVWGEELAEKDISRTLRIPHPDGLADSLLNTVSPRKPGEQLVMQLVLSPARNVQKPSQHATGPITGNSWLDMVLGTAHEDSDALSDQRSKLDEPNFEGILRVAAKADTKPNARHLVGDVLRALRGTRKSGNGWRLRRVTQKILYERIRLAKAPWLFGVCLMVTELAGLMAWPLEKAYAPGLPQGRTRQLPPSDAILTEGRVVATATYPGMERPLALGAVESCQHFVACGPTGAGKTQGLANMIAQDIGRGSPVIVLENKPSLDLFNAALDAVPLEGIENTIIVDVLDTERPPAYNILQGNPYVVATKFQQLFASMYADSGKGVRLPASLYHGILTLKTSTAATKPMTFVDLVPLFVPMGNEEKRFSQEMIEGVPDAHIRNYWETNVKNRKAEQRDVFFAPVMERIWQLNARAPIRNIIGQSESSFNIAQAIREKKTLIINASGLGDDIADLFVTLIFSDIWGAAQGGACDPNDPTYLFADEAYKYMKLPIPMPDLFAQARSSGLSLNMATQSVKMLPEYVRSAMLTNVHSWAVFRPGPDDAPILARVFGNKVSEQDLMNLGKYEIIGQLETPKGTSKPFTAVTMPPIRKLGNANRAREYSRQKHGRPVAEVEREIAERRVIAKEPTQKSRLGARQRQDV